MSNPACPKCGGPTVKAGHEPENGKQRYKHAACKWKGVDPATKGHRTTIRMQLPTQSVRYPEVDPVSRLPGVSQYDGVTELQPGTYIVTSAQNATPVDEVWETLKNIADHMQAKLMVIPYRYKNATSQWTEKNEADDWWASQVRPFIVDHRVNAGPHMEIRGDIMVQPTAPRPLSGFETITGSRSCIIGHPKLELMTIPTPQKKLPKILTTTGACTVRNYVDAKAGRKASFHHTFGAALLILAADGKFHIRQLNANDMKEIQDLRTIYSPSGSWEGKIRAVVLGDYHDKFKDPVADKAVFGKGGIVDKLRPEWLVWHDVHDGYSINPHIKSTMEKMVRAAGGGADVERELDATFASIDARHRPGMGHVFPHSNHPGWLTQWAENFDFQRDFMNSLFWAKTRVLMEKAGMGMGPKGPVIPEVFPLWAKVKLKSFDWCRFLAPDEPFMVEGIDLGMHGHLGPNGARGNLRSLAKIGVKFVIGHVHGPGIFEGGMAVGTLSVLDPAYAKGPSNWLHTLCLVYETGKRSLVNIIDGDSGL